MICFEVIVSRVHAHGVICGDEVEPAGDGRRLCGSLKHCKNEIHMAHNLIGTT